MKSLVRVAIASFWANALLEVKETELGIADYKGKSNELHSSAGFKWLKEAIHLLPL